MSVMLLEMTVGVSSYLRKVRSSRKTHIMGLAIYILLSMSIVVTSIFTFFYFYLISIFNYWKERGVPYIKPTFPFGNLGDVILGRKSLIDLTIEQYNQFQDKRYFGIFNLNKPVLVVRDILLIEKIMKTDFAYFCNKVEEPPGEDDCLGYNLGTLQGDTWRQVRQRLNAAFSFSKLKQMTEPINTCADNFIGQISEYETGKKPALADCLGYTFSSKVIANCVFGIECDNTGLKEFISNVKKRFMNMKVIHLISLWPSYIPSLMYFLYSFPPVSSVVKYFKGLTSASISVRQQMQVKRNDFLQILLDLKEDDFTHKNNKNTTNGYSKTKERKISVAGEKELISDNFITSTLFAFMSLGMESSAVAITFLLYDLATNKDIQEKVYQEITSAMKKHGELNYEAIQQLTYLDSVIQESVRMNPGFAYIMRVCETPYRVPDSELVIEKGTRVLIPVSAIHLDPQFYQDPNIFNPERFTNNHYKPSPTFLTFGAGPRMCIAVKLVILELKIAIAKMLLEYSVVLSSDCQLPIRFAPTFMAKIQDVIYVEFQRRT